MIYRNDVPVSTLRDLLIYHPDLGLLFWRKTGRQAFKSINSRGYKVGAIRRVVYRAHRVIWALHTGEWPPEEIDHINRDKTDNRFSNLRCVTHAENMQNKEPVTRKGAGIRWHREKGRWQARIQIQGRERHLGYFADEQSAIDARARAVEMFFPNSRTE